VDKITWDNSPQMRQSVERELDNWGAWSQGGHTNLGYPRQMAGASPPDADPPPPVDVDAAWRTEQVLTAWARHGKDAAGIAGLFLLKCKYVERRPIEKTTFDYRRKFRTGHTESAISAMIDEAEWFYFLLTRG